MSAQEDQVAVQREEQRTDYTPEHIGKLKTLFENPNIHDLHLDVIRAPDKIINFHDGPIYWNPAPKSERASVGIIYVMTADGKCAFPAPWEAKGGHHDWYHFREALRYGVDGVAAARTMRRGNNDEKPLLLSFYDPELAAYRQDTLGMPRHPRGVIATGSGNIVGGLDHAVFKLEGETTIITSDEGVKKLQSLVDEDPRVSMVSVGQTGSTMDMEKMLQVLKSDYGVNRLLVLGGPSFSSALVKARLVDNYFVNLSTAISGDKNIRSWFSDSEGFDSSDLPELATVSIKIGDNIQGEGAYTTFHHWIPQR